MWTKRLVAPWRRDGFRRLLADEHARSGQAAGDLLDLPDDVGRGRVGNAHDQRALAGGRLRATEMVDARAGRIADDEVVEEGARPVEQGVEGDVVQEIVGHDHQAARGQARPDGTDQVRVEAAQMGGGGVLHAPRKVRT
jgi:hypothetical protein